MELFVKTLAGATVVVIIQLLSRTKNVYLAGLVPLFPTFALIANYIVGTGVTTNDLRETIVFGMFSLIPYLFYLATLSIFSLTDLNSCRPCWERLFPG
jgi:membrane protein GlpM